MFKWWISTGTEVFKSSWVWQIWGCSFSPFLFSSLLCTVRQASGVWVFLWSLVRPAGELLWTPWEWAVLRSFQAFQHGRTRGGRFLMRDGPAFRALHQKSYGWQMLLKKPAHSIQGGASSILQLKKGHTLGYSQGWVLESDFRGKTWPLSP